MRVARWMLAVLLAPLVIAPVAGAAQRHSRTLVFDARAARLRTAGKEQRARGRLLDADARTVGTFAYVCRRVGGTPTAARERCAGRATVRGGTLLFAGPSRSDSLEHRSRITRAAGVFSGARGILAIHDLDERESIVTATLPLAASAPGEVPRPRADARFRRRADGRCAAAAGRLSTLPPFPLQNFDPLHPDPGQLPTVGQFFTGRGDPRPIFADLQAQLAALGRPPAARAAWRRVPRALAAMLRNIDAQDRAALAADVPAFVRTVRRTTTVARESAIAALAFGTPRCRF